MRTHNKCVVVLAVATCSSCIGSSSPARLVVGDVKVESDGSVLRVDLQASEGVADVCVGPGNATCLVALQAQIASQASQLASLVGQMESQASQLAALSAQTTSQASQLAAVASNQRAAALRKEGPWIFDGSDGRISDLYTSVVTGNGARTVILSLKTTASDTIPFSLGAGSAACNGHWAIAPRATAWAVYGRCGPYDEYVTVSTNVIDGAWHRIAVTFEPSSRRIRMYADGAEVGDSYLRDHGESYSTNAGYVIGGWVNADRYYNGALRAIEVHDAVLPDVAARTLPLPLAPVFVTEDSLSFDGSDQRITSSTPRILINNAARTLVLSLKTTASDTIPFSLGAGSAACNGHWAIAPRATAWAVYGRCGPYDEYVTVSTNVIDGAWHRIAVTFEPSSRRIRMYADGAEVGDSYLRDHGESYSTNAGYVIGGWVNADRYYNGQVRNISVYDDALSPEQLLPMMSPTF